MDFDKLRADMVAKQLKERDITDFRVLEAMGRIPRHEFVPPEIRHLAYRDGALPIGHNQTISQPYVVALMLQALHLSGHEIVLEIGTGSGYQTALLCAMAARVYSIERNSDLGEQAATRLAELNCDNVEIHVGDGSQGLADMSPFDAIIVSASVPTIPGPLRAQLRNNGRLVLPVGTRHQQHLEVVRRDFDKWDVERLIPVRFVPLIGRYGFEE